MKMKRIGVFLLTVLCVAGALPATVQAEHFEGDPNWHVEFTPQAEMVSNFKTADLDEAVAGLQPGDDIVFTLGLQNKHKETTNWYMTNEVLYSLEDRSKNKDTAGGAYTYILTYIDRNGEETVLFSSDTVGGEDVSEAGEGLNEATSSLEDFFFLDTLANGESGSIRLVVRLDGETQGNDYQDTLADLQMNFAVELATTTSRERTSPREARTTIVATGDRNMPVVYIVAMAVSGLLLLILAIVAYRYSRRERGSRKGGRTS